MSFAFRKARSFVGWLNVIKHSVVNHFLLSFNCRGGEWYHEKRGSRKILAGSRNLGSVFDRSRSLVFAWFVFTFLSLETFYQRVSGSDF